MTTVITGAAGFIGSQLSLRLLSKKKKVIGIDFSKELIKVAKVTNHAENISYISKDVLTQKIQ